MDDQIRQRLHNTIRFMNLTAIQLRRLAEREPEFNDQLRRSPISLRRMRTS
jgi:hypothetical protein